VERPAPGEAANGIDQQVQTPEMFRDTVDETSHASTIRRIGLFRPQHVITPAEVRAQGLSVLGMPIGHRYTGTFGCEQERDATAQRTRPTCHHGNLTVKRLHLPFS
jgi:hypothetical protein